MDQYTDEHTTFEYSYSMRGGGSINHPSVDRFSDYSVMSEKGHHHSNYSLHNIVEKSKRSKNAKHVTQQRQRASSQPTTNILLGIGSSSSSAALLSRSFVSEPTMRLRPATTGNSSYLSSSIKTSSLHNSSSTSSASRSSVDQVLSDRPSETRLRIERSISNIREQQARSASRVSSSSSPNIKSDLGYQGRTSMTNDRHHRQQRTTATSNDAVGTLDPRELAVKDHAWETDFQQRTMDAIDERYKQVTSSLEARIKILEEEMKRANEDMEVSREYVSQIQGQISCDAPVDCGVQTSIQGVREISDSESKKKKITAFEELLRELGFDNMHDFDKAVHDWRTKAKSFDQVQSFVDRVDDVIWETPFISLLSVCQQHKNLISLIRNSAEDICETHRTQYEKALLEAERDKTRAHSSMPYSSEHLDVTFERLVRWAHMVRHVTS